MRFPGRGILVITLLLVTLSIGSCTAAAPGGTTPGTTANTASTTPTSTALPYAIDLLSSVPGIVDPSNRGWPREVQGMNGTVVIESKPQRIHSLSLGHDEVTYALVPASRVIAVGRYTQDPLYSNVAGLAQSVPGISREPEQIVAQQPDLVIAANNTKIDLIKALENVGLVVIQTELHNDPQGRIQDILFLGYLYGEEDRAIELAGEVQRRSDALAAFASGIPDEERPRVLSLTSYSDKIYTAGKGSTEGTIIEVAGALNAATEAGIEGNKTVSSEGIISMRPEVIYIAQPEASGGPFRERLLSDPALADVPAIKQQRVYLVEARFFTTLSFWNLRGAEQLTSILWPEKFNDKDFASFSFPD